MGNPIASNKKSSAKPRIPTSMGLIFQKAS
jgi:hypothetical protein